MAFVEPITIKDAVENIHRKNYLLPAIQREFVWSVDQIEKLFDSLMRGYPISSFLFWDVEKSNVKNYQFYEFVQNYHERENKHNPKANLNGENGITAILDGQQRLTSLYIGLKGTYAYKLTRKRWNNDSAFPKRKLCLNLLAPSENAELEYDFSFLTNEEISRTDENHFWFIVGDILDLNEAVDVNEYLVNKNLPGLGIDKFRFANKTLFKLYEVVHMTKSINFFLEKDESLDKVLNIFVRLNSGGSQLSHSDLLLSIATAEWADRDAREEITLFVDEINKIGNGFNFNKDFVLKNCLALTGKDMAFKVDNFKKSTLLDIEKDWDGITKAIKNAVLLLASFGYYRDTLTSNNALIPIACYIKKIGNPENFCTSSKYDSDRKTIFKWLVLVLLKRLFGGQSDAVLKILREVVSSSINGFPYPEMVEKLKGTPKAMTFDDDEIENLLDCQYGQPYTYSVLAFIYPTLDFRQKFHQDHIFPKKIFNRKELLKRGIKEDQVDFYLDNFNSLGNIQLLEGTPNQEKSGKDFSDWIVECYPDMNLREIYKNRNYIPEVDLSLENFPIFIEQRQRLITAEFKKLLT